MIRRLHLLLLTLFLIIVAFLYYPLFYTFYQQDEWIALGGILTTSFFDVVKGFTITKLLVGGRILGLLIQYPLYSLFPLQVFHFAVLSIILHALNSFLVFLVAQKISKNFLLSFMAALFFICASVSSQSVIWFGASLTVLPNGFFSLLSILFYIISIEKRKTSYFYYSFIFFVASSLFKESSYFLPVFFIILEFILNKKRPRLKEVLKKNSIYILIMIIAALFIFPRIFLLKNQTGHIVSASGNSKERVIINTLFYPLETFSQLYINGNIIYPLAEKIISLRFQQLSEGAYLPITAQTIGGDFVSIFISIILLALVFFIYFSKTQMRKVILASLMFLPLSLTPFIVFDKQTSFFESRYYYLPVISGSLLFGVVSVFLFDQLQKLKLLWPFLRLGLFFLVIFLSLYFQIYYVKKDLQQQVIDGQERLKILSTISKLYPKISSNTVFYVDGNVSYYVDGNKVPFQQGMGYTLMVYYLGISDVSRELIQKEFLWGLTDQGYKSIKGKSFGYYTDIEKLKKDKKLFNKNSKIIGLYYDGKKKIIKDITPNLPHELQI